MPLVLNAEDTLALEKLTVYVNTDFGVPDNRGDHEAPGRSFFSFSVHLKP